MSRLYLAFALPVVVLTTLAAGCATTQPEPAAGPTVGMEIDPARADTAVFAGGCFWCMEKPFEELEGVASVVSGFAGGDVPNPTYDQVTTKTTGHYEVVEVIYDATVVPYDTLLQVYWHNVDPLDGGGQFCDRGSPYRPAIFVSTASERAAAEQTKEFLNGRFSSPVAVEILDAAPFYAAEEYHQDFYRTNPARYTSYRIGCRRDARLDELWGDNAGVLGPAL
ncbi:peptide-methionine (S)-S-oxide reductase MsrA [Rubrivirga sp.]|uniref:peptide-methionine (S)-S-oxide reductase MsrA n=1 Tax=Rubrivirga sp. TaxID=1885344 RepID=UPI003C78273C